MGFVEITILIERALGAEPAAELASIEACVDVDARTRRRVAGWVDGRAKG
jgi:hypothetical protein